MTPAASASERTDTERPSDERLAEFVAYANRIVDDTPLGSREQMLARTAIDLVRGLREATP
jgi:uncharacterized protein YciW